VERAESFVHKVQGIHFLPGNQGFAEGRRRLEKKGFDQRGDTSFRSPDGPRDFLRKGGILPRKFMPGTEVLSWGGGVRS